MSFTRKLVNRLNMPTRHIVVCEDDLEQQARIATKLASMFGGQSDVQVSFVPGAEMAAAIIQKVPVNLILLDHDMPYGDGVELLKSFAGLLTASNLKVITFSGIPSNNTNLMNAGAHINCTKDEVINGHADYEIMGALLFND